MFLCKEWYAGIIISRCAHPFCERKCANAAVGLNHLAALKIVKYGVLDVIIDYCDVEIIIERCNAMTNTIGRKNDPKYIAELSIVPPLQQQPKQGPCLYMCFQDHAIHKEQCALIFGCKFVDLGPYWGLLLPIASK